MEPMSSFAEWKCAACGAVRNVPTQLAEATRKRRRGAIRWPLGWEYRPVGVFGIVVCERCAPKRDEATP